MKITHEQYLNNLLKDRIYGLKVLKEEKKIYNTVADEKIREYEAQIWHLEKHLEKE